MTRRTSPPPSAADRRFLLLQGPHGPFFARLGDLLRTAGAEVWRVGFNRGDAFFWRGPNYIAFRAPLGEWEARLADLLTELRITDIALYGDSRPIHATAIRLAKERGLRIHVFEEGYLRPYWITYERDGSNGNSRLMQLDLATMRAALARPGAEQPPAPVHWGDMREHMFYGALYHFLILTMNRAYPGHRPHREIGVAREARLHLQRFFTMPFVRIGRRLAERRIRQSGFPYHLVLLQLEHDASFRAHSDFASMADFVTQCLDAFARGAAAHHHLVFKAHPLEDGRLPLARLIREGAAARGLSARVHFVTGGKLAQLLREAASAVTVNSTAAQQALWRGLPVKLLGRAVYDKPDFVSPQPLAEFFAAPARPDSRAYSDYRQFLLETSQIPGGFYSAAGRRRALRRVVDMMLAPHDPYVTLLQAAAAERQHIRAVN
ncbi:capsular biosynthesis protein [Frigidibacter sp. SD6-1]|uniref:capsule biosynthesis protein n=1 Tax=Frigidibacter sp. SD6-1 TaxID=3032581 RepID=UPI0024DF3474|nr:capsular biosynthesis protein [Frigidibacter sp. SD6-1]